MTNARWLVATLALASAVPLLAQERRREPEERIRLLVGEVMQRRARLGVVVALNAKETDSLGAFIESVTPGGPAARAGIRSGDIITRLDGQSVLDTDGTRARRGESLPGLRLVELAAKLEPDDTITVEYLRGDARRTGQVVTGDEPVRAAELDRFREFAIEPVPAPGRVEVRRMPVGEEGFRVFLGGFSDLELAPMNSDLAWYFGTSEGVLVLRVDQDSRLGVRPGDVILTIDGRKPSSAASLLRILRSYEPGESIRLEIMRQKQRQTVTGTIERPGRDW